MNLKTIELLVGICFKTERCARQCNQEKVAKRPYWPRGRCMWVINICLLQKVVALVLKMCVGSNVDDESSQRKEGSWNDDKEETL